ncbi:MAG: FecR family protein [Agitococcus sp.]|nr:FecR family protein [Agitococcus sp.]
MVKNSTYVKPALLSGRGLLATFVGLLLTGQVLAETAGRVNFVVGEVSAISNDGSRRVLGRGDLVNSGERLETGKGRLQIRFTDGSFISLQPNTVFGLDNYAFNKAKPNEGTLLFNFIRGGMRTVSGAIGKVNRNNYRVQTPVATIGIRGTSYAAEQQPNGRLLLTVSKGMVNISNDFGSGNVSTGQTFQTTKDKAPESAPDGVSVSARASDPESKEQQKEQAKETASNSDDKKPDIAIGDQVSEDGNPLFESFIQTTDGIPRLSSFGSLLKGTSGVSIYPNVLAAYDSVSENGLEVGNLTRLISTNETGDVASGKLILNTRNGLKSLNFANVKQFGSLSLGEWTDGTAASVDAYLHEGSLTLSKTQFIPYIVGVTAEKNLGNNAKVSYVLVGNTPVRAGSGANLATDMLTKLNIDIDLNLIPLVSIDMGLTLANVGYTAQLTDKQIDVSLDKKLSGFVLNGTGDQFFAQSTDSSCANNQCPVNLSAFFSSSDLGVVYEIERLNNTTIGGVAALSGTETTITSTIPSATRLDSSLTGVYSAFFSTNTQLATSKQTQLAAVFDSSTAKLLSAFHVSNNNGELAVADEYAPIKTVSSNAATSSDVGHFAKVLSWGAWSNGAVVLGLTPNQASNTQSLIGNSNIHYLIGLPTAASAIPQTGSVTYSLVGGTNPKAIFGTLGTGDTVISAADTGSINANSNLVVDFARANASLNLGIDGLTKAGVLSGINLTGSTALTGSDLNFNSLSVSAITSNGTALGCNSCTGTATGSFFGAVNAIGTTGVSAPQAVGLTYNVSGTVQAGQTPTSVGINGAAAFGNAIVTPAAGG